jgi:tryprostatin B 6-hydroxylase
MHTTRDRPLHDRRRRIWSPAFSDKSLRNYEQRVKPYADALVRRIEGYNGQPVNVAQLVSITYLLFERKTDSCQFNFFGYDVMGDLAFGKDFAMLSSGKEHYAVQLLNEGMQPFANFRKYLGDDLSPHILIAISTYLALQDAGRYSSPGCWLSQICEIL